MSKVDTSRTGDDIPSGLTSTSLLVDARSRLLASTGQLARYCDKSEHNEVADAAIISSCAGDLRAVGVLLLRSQGCSPVAEMAGRLGSIEQRNVLHSDESFDVLKHVHDRSTWREFQLAQARHDAEFHPDVLGQRKDDQLRHYTLHLAKLCWLMDLAVAQGNAFDVGRSADIAIFGIKLSTLVGVRLPDEPIDVAS